VVSASPRVKRLGWTRALQLCLIATITTLALCGAAGSAGATTTDLVLRVTPSNFSSDRFTLDDGGSRTVSPGFLIGLHVGVPRGIYEVTLASPSLRADYVLTIRVSGPNVRVYRRGGPFTTDAPSFRLTGVGSSLEPAVVTVSLRRGHSPTTTTVATTSTTTTTDGPTS
jgi:hypothetical protein